MSRLFSRDELLSLYSQVLGNEKERVIKAIQPASLFPFSSNGIMSEEQQRDWSSMGRHDSRKALVDFVLSENDLDCYIKFSQCVHYINEGEAEQIFDFIPNLISVGLHDSIRIKGQ